MTTHELVVWIISLPLAVLIALLLVSMVEAHRQRRVPKNWRKW